MSYILGINSFHGDASACILKDGVLLAAAEEERFLRVKHWAGFPKQSISYCLREAGISMDDIATIAVNSDPKANYLRKIIHILRYRVDLALVKDRLLNSEARKSLAQSIKESFPGQKFSGQIRHINHHVAHLASAFYVSPYKESAVVSIDGFGDFSSGCWGVGNGSNLVVGGSVYYPHSLGAFYQAITQLIGFPNYGDEYKVMGLAPYGEAKYLDKMRKIVLLQKDGSYKLDLKYFIFHKEKVEYEWNNGSPSVGKLFSDALEDLLGKARQKDDELTQLHKDIAASAQAMFEVALFHMLNKLSDTTGLDSICLAGGCGNNSVANGKIRANTKFKNVYVAASAGDAGGAIGAAYALYHEDNDRNVTKTAMEHAYLGPSYSNEQIAELIKSHGKNLPKSEFSIIKTDSLDDLTKRTATAIAEGKVIGWFQGRMEWGPRALGNRSILGDPRRADMKEILNVKIKRRESFRPFAPSILRESVGEWFEDDDEVPFMMKVFPVKAGKRSEIPAVTHVDGSGRLQTVYKKTNPRYHALISEFYLMTGVPILLNTSFNENEPVVCAPAEALDCFLRTKMDVVVLNDYFIFRH
jgi:carbamoyltransferase